MPCCKCKPRWPFRELLGRHLLTPIRHISPTLESHPLVYTQPKSVSVFPKTLTRRHYSTVHNSRMEIRVHEEWSGQAVAHHSTAALKTQPPATGSSVIRHRSSSPWPVWLGGLSAGLRTERSPVGFRQGTCLGYGPGPQMGACEWQWIAASLPSFPSL